ncbi:MAG TPA: D-alanine--D-alanine ligase [Leptospiraceae bacterium]|nr:D-alanine--D-alanine ligase [Leptospiraceae bacterium]HRG73265.1 D-alanine--D-alanine ligase [Leptospiraceae bacterium]
MLKRKVILLADIYDSLPEVSFKQKQEWESQKSIDYLMKTISSLGYDSILIEPKLSKTKVLEAIKDILETGNIQNTILFNLVEGFESRNREGYIPSLGEFMGIPFTGSDTYAQTVSLDKGLMKLICKRARIPTKSFHVIEKIEDLSDTIDYPLFLKPNGEGSSLGINETSVIRNSRELYRKTEELLSEFDSILLEELLVGDDLTLGVIGNYPDYKATSVAKINYPSTVYGEDIKTKESMPETLSFSISRSLESKIQRDSIHICNRLRTSGYARLDWKCDAMGNPFFLEINLTPGLSAYYSSLPICYEASFGNYSDLIKKVLHFGYENYNTNKIFRYGILEKNEFG